MYEKLKVKKQKVKKEIKKKRAKEVKELGDNAPPKEAPKTIDTTRTPNETFLSISDEEVNIIFLTCFD